jgi:hypothetical protein
MWGESGGVMGGVLDGDRGGSGGVTERELRLGEYCPSSDASEPRHFGCVIVNCAAR